MDERILKTKIIHLPLVFLNWAGLVRFKNERFSIINYFKGYFSILSYLFYNISQIVFFLEHYNETARITLVGGTYALYSTVWTKSWTMIKYRNEFAKLFKKIHEDSQRIELSGDKKQQEILHIYIGRSSKLAWILELNVIMTCSIFAVYSAWVCFISHR